MFDENETLASHLEKQKRERHGHGTESLENPSSSTSSSTTMTMSNLPTDLLTEVFYKLPAETLVKLSCVSKTLFSVITRPHFIKTHLSLEKSNQIKWYFSAYRLPYELHMLSGDGVRSNALNSPPDFDKGMRWRIAESCNGALLCVAGNGVGYDYELWNPCINRKLRIPKPNKLRPSGGQVVLGLGYDSVKNDYKLVRVSKVVEVYTVSNGSWRTLSTSDSDQFPFSDVGDTRSAVIVNGCPHWLVSGKCILYFNVTIDKFQKMEMPDYSSIPDEIFLQLTVCSGLLSFVYRKWIWSMTLWVMKEYGRKESWTMFPSINPFKFAPYMADPLFYLPYTPSLALFSEGYFTPNKKDKKRKEVND